METRTAVLLAALALLGFLGFLTVRVIVRDGVTPVVVLALGMLAFIGIGVVGALTTPPDE